MVSQITGAHKCLLGAFLKAVVGAAQLSAAIGHKQSPKLSFIPEHTDSRSEHKLQVAH